MIEKEDVSFIGYHGTSLENYEKIEDENFIIREGVYLPLGLGIYFYEEYDLALKWASRKYDISQITIMRARIYGLADNVFDTRKHNEQAKYKREMLKFIDGISSIKGYDLSYAEFFALFFYILRNSIKKEIIIHRFDIEEIKKDFGVPRVQSLREIDLGVFDGTQICVTNIRCISSFANVYLDEEEN